MNSPAHKSRLAGPQATHKSPKRAGALGQEILDKILGADGPGNSGAPCWCAVIALEARAQTSGPAHAGKLTPDRVGFVRGRSGARGDALRLRHLQVRRGRRRKALHLRLVRWAEL